MNQDIRKRYFEWLQELIGGDRFIGDNSFSKLFKCLHDTEFVWIIPIDSNRAEDGIGLRGRFAHENNIAHYDKLDGPCSILEMMVALSIRCEDIMDDTKYGDRTGQWFWRMINSLGLSGMYDGHFDIDYVEDILDRFLDHEYEPDGHGGLFTVKYYDKDMRYVEIWTQMLWFLDDII